MFSTENKIVSQTLPLQPLKIAVSVNLIFNYLYISYGITGRHSRITKRREVYTL